MDYIKNKNQVNSIVPDQFASAKFYQKYFPEEYHQLFLDFLKYTEYEKIEDIWRVMDNSFEL